MPLSEGFLQWRMTYTFRALVREIGHVWGIGKHHGVDIRRDGSMRKNERHVLHIRVGQNTSMR